MERAIFIHNAVHPGGSGMVVDIGSDEFGAAVLANVAAPLVLAGAFPAIAAGVDARVALVSSNAAGVPFPGASVYCAGKAAIEHWVRAVRREVEHDRRTPSVMAIRPGLVDTPGARQTASRDPLALPTGGSDARGTPAGKRRRPDRGRSADVGGHPRHRG